MSHFGKISNAIANIEKEKEGYFKFLNDGLKFHLQYYKDNITSHNYFKEFKITIDYNTFLIKIEIILEEKNQRIHNGVFMIDKIRDFMSNKSYDLFSIDFYQNNNIFLNENNKLTLYFTNKEN